MTPNITTILFFYLKQFNRFFVSFLIKAEQYVIENVPGGKTLVVKKVFLKR